MMAIIFLIIGETKSNVLDELLSSVKILNEKIDKMSLEQIKMKTELQDDIRNLRSEMNSKLESICKENFPTKNSTVPTTEIEHELNETLNEERTEMYFPEILKNEKAILVVGGLQVSTSVEVHNSNGSPFCRLPDLPSERFLHTIDEGLICGGAEHAETSCLQFEGGTWVKFNWNLLNKRKMHVSWKRPDGGVQLMGGKEDESSRTTEVVTSTGSKPGFDLKYETVGACAIKLEKFVVITGGNNSMSTVSSYDMYGWMMDLPNLNTGRGFHGCGHYLNEAKELIFLVTGGGGTNHPDDFHLLTSTEIISQYGSSWEFVGNLPKETYIMAGISLNNRVFVSGGCGRDQKHCYSDILIFDPTTKNWWNNEYILSDSRIGHTMSVLPEIDDIYPFCV